MKLSPADIAARKAFYRRGFVEKYGREPAADSDLLLYLRQLHAATEVAGTSRPLVEVLRPAARE